MGKKKAILRKMLQKHTRKDCRQLVQDLSFHLSNALPVLENTQNTGKSLANAV